MKNSLLRYVAAFLYFKWIYPISFSSWFLLRRCSIQQSCCINSLHPFFHKMLSTFHFTSEHWSFLTNSREITIDSSIFTGNIFIFLRTFEFTKAPSQSLFAQIHSEVNDRNFQKLRLVLLLHPLKWNKNTLMMNSPECNEILALYY